MMKNVSSVGNKQAFAQAKNPAPLSGPLRHKLNAYALAAGAAGVAVLACASPAEGSPICKTLSTQLMHTDNFPLYLGQPTIAPFNIAQGTNSTFFSFTTTGRGTLQWWNRGFFTPNSAGAKVLLSNGLPANLASGAQIGPGGEFGKGSSYGLLFTYGRGEASFHGGGTKLKHRGNFNLLQSNYIGFQFNESGVPHFGWARLAMSFQKVSGKVQHTVTHILGYGYESAANTVIAAGSCSAEEAEVLPRKDTLSVSPRASSGASSGASSAGASLGSLALGSAGAANRQVLSR
jgi:hypothetical protein